MMKRLTARKGNEVYVECGDRIDITPQETNKMVIERLAAYEDAEEQGRLVVLPCKVGDLVWSADFDGAYTFKFEIRHLPRIGKDIFLTREEAEKALEGMG